MGLLKQIAVLALIAAGAAGALSWSGAFSEANTTDSRKAKSGPVPVLVERVNVATDKRLIEAVGTARADKSVILFAEVAGEIKDIRFAAGAEVKKGEIILRLDADEERLAVSYATVEIEDFQRKLTRAERLAKTGNMSAVSLDDARTSLRLAEVRLDQAKVALEDRLVRAPFDGVVGIFQVDPGDRVDADTPLVTLDDQRVLLVDFLVPETAVRFVSVGQAVPIQAWSREEKWLEGIITALDSRIDPRTRRLLVRAKVPNGDGELRPGASFAVRLEVTGGNYPVVPEVAVLWSREGPHVWRITDGKAERLYVDIIRRERGRALIKGDVKAGDQIVIEGLQSMRPGRAVTVRGTSAGG